MWIGSDIIYDHYHRRIKSRIFRFCSCGERVPKIQEMRGALQPRKLQQGSGGAVASGDRVEG